MHQGIPLPSPFTTTDAEDAGVSRNALARLLRDGLTVKHRPDLYWNSWEYRTATPTQRHLRAAIRVSRALSSDVVIARTAAAGMLGLATPLPLHDGREELQFYTRNTQTARTRTGLHIYTTPLPLDEIIELDGVAVTSVARTTVDLARSHALPKSLIVIDSALRLGLSLELLLQQCKRQAGWRGMHSVTRALPFGTPLAESALESESRGRFIEVGLPIPRSQVELSGASGRKYRVDFYWQRFGLIGEADGWGKFGMSDAEQQAAFRREKLREDDLRNAGFRVVRWTYHTLATAIAVIRGHVASV